MLLRWNDLGSPRADQAGDTTIEIAGFLAPLRPEQRTTHCLLVPGGC